MEEKTKVIEELMKKAAAKGAELIIEDTGLSSERYSSLWYGGHIADVKFPGGHILSVDAIGDVYASLHDENGELIADVRDKNNAGVFGKEMRPFIRTDAELIEKEGAGLLQFENNNWYEISYLDPDGEFYDLEWVSDGDNWASAIEDAIDGLDATLQWLKQ